jgi:hypothetical protein
MELVGNVTEASPGLFFFSCKIILRFSFSEQLKKYYVLSRG